ncbi:hypothetical protein DFH07DRAFT_836669 [Mycena maculata]|uniref:Uncharacterized protein n=1 Tax=Mycena maculata TaxID=230809 RepID=A0AAD7N264_9AGAR|nr:hypothetical protein DFH07DRAFT_836669 [Mycena maculata]
MGQRHQVFMVARVALRGATTTRYRCVGAFHHQWCYGRLPLKAARRFITLIKQKDNAEIVKDELRAIQGKYGSSADTSEPKFPDIPCPYSTFLLASAWCVDLEGPNYYASGVSFQNSVLETTMGSADGDNNDGITVFDVTDPTNPSYCFVSIYGLEAGGRVEERVPLSAEQYVRAYYRIPSGTEKEDEHVKLTEQDVQEKIDSLRHERLMTLDVLAEAWPHEYKKPATTPSAVEDTAPASTAFPNLADLSLKPAVEHAIQVGEIEELERLVWHPGKAKRIKSILQAQNPFPDSALPLLAKVVQHEAETGETVLDLGLPLSGPQVVAFLTLSERSNVELLNLSHNPNLTLDGLYQILSATPKLRRLVLLDTSISDEHILQLLKADSKLPNTVEELIHPALLSAQDPAGYPTRFAYAGLNHHMHNASTASLAIFTPASIVQCLTDLLFPFAYASAYDLYSLTGSSLVPQAAFASGMRSEEVPWGQRKIHCFPAHVDDPFHGPSSWLFAASWSSFDPSAHRYGFVFIEGTAGGAARKWKLCDLGGFLKGMESEGRPLPTDSAVEKLEGIFTKLTSQGSKFWTDDEFSPFMPTFMMCHNSRY